MDRLVGGGGTIATKKPVKTVGSFWPYATTLFDFVRRAMPFDAPQSLSPAETYAVCAYVLFLNGLLAADATLIFAAGLPSVRRFFLAHGVIVTRVVGVMFIAFGAKSIFDAANGALRKA